ncbi:LPS biosynthesis protein [miscellaneous Crenarchaeota group-1 archaeon SG8-32-1]|uniref:LPS biosynthesis protein n=1 Tax=miscellaneous Crenarchaeota group-1 archaeon SG8-32-1 TaxID=1685124 RepID=A0A0M0BWV0_9ARCH|nr:MAG: LPS biosynthesis protein [miscellaneous Crenarchaeota group-1 archaeon SG8-32-1]
MRILQICHRYFPFFGGVEEHVRQISERLAKENEVEVCTTDSSGKLARTEVVNGVEVKRFDCYAPNNAYYFSSEMKKYLKENSNSFDVVHAHNYHAFPALYAAQTKKGNKLIFTPHYHGRGNTFFRSLLHRPYKFFGGKIFAKADKVICVSNYEKNLILENFGEIEGKLVLIPNGVDFQEFRALKEKKGGSKVILTVGRLEQYKGIQHLIGVLPKLETDVVLEIIGEGPYMSSLVKLAKDLSVEKRVSFFQKLSKADVLQKYVDAGVFVLLSERESYGMTVAEALLCGTSCIVANASALIEWVDNKNCYGVDYPIDQNQLKLLIEKLMGQATSRLNNSVLDWKDVTEKLLNVYKDT